jgi:hypothetical protein
MTGILVCRRSAGFNRHPRVSLAFITRPSPPGLVALQTVRGELRFSKPPQDTATELLRKLTRASPGRSPRRFRALTGTSGFHDTSGCHPIASGRSPADFPTRPAFRGRQHDLRLARTTPVVHQVRRVCHRASPDAHPEPSGSTGFSSEAHRSPVSPYSPFCGDSIVSLLRTTRSKGPGQTAHRLWRHGGHFRGDPRLSSLNRR